MHSVCVIGAGVVGLATALRLQQEGFEVTIFDRHPPGSMASRGNAAGIAWTDVEPLASKGIWKKIPSWLFDPLGPLSIRPRYSLRVLPWMMRFCRSAMPDKIVLSMEGKAALNLAALPAWERLWQATGTRHHVNLKGCLEIFDREDHIKSARRGWAHQRSYGIEVQELTRDAIRDLEPDFSQQVVGGALVPGWLTIDDPYKLCQSMADAFQKSGGHIQRGSVRALAPKNEGVMIHGEDENSSQFDHVVLAGGIWSKELAAQLGDAVPLESERGYNTTFASPSVSLKHAVMLPGLGFAITQLSDGIRIGGAVEFGGLDLPPNWKRAEAMTRLAKRFLPQMEPKEGKQWMGHRPSLPDTLPVIGPSLSSPRVTYAFGHGHHGLTQAAVTADLVAAFIVGTSAPINCELYSAQRF